MSTLPYREIIELRSVGLSFEKVAFLCGCSTTKASAVSRRAAELGLGSCWCAIYPLEQEMAGFKQLFGLPDQVEAFSLIVLGYPAEEKPQPDRDPAGHTHWEQW